MPQLEKEEGFMFKKNRFMVRIAALAVGAAMTAGLLGGCAGKKENESTAA